MQPNNSAPSRRSPGTGTLTPRTTKTGTRRLEAQVALPPTADGRRRNKSRWFEDSTKGRAAAQDWISSVRSEIAAGLHDPAAETAAAASTAPAVLTMSGWMAEWLATRKSLVKASTHRSYSDLWRIHGSPQLADVPLADLTPRRLTAAYAAMRDAGTSAATVHAVHRTLRASLTSARKAGLVPVNPAMDAELARPQRFIARTWTPAEAQKFLASNKASGDRLAPLWRFLLVTGVRRGEGLGLQWDDVDLTAGTALIHRNLSEVGGVTARSTVKSDKSHRTLSLDSGTVTELVEWRDRLTVESATVAVWHGAPEVFLDESGQHHTPDRISKLFSAACRSAGVPVIRLHDLRHTNASLLLAAGVGIHAVSAQLGHSSISVTADVYGHHAAATSRASADIMGGLLGS